jgi:transmembrane sensor
MTTSHKSHDLIRDQAIEWLMLFEEGQVDDASKQAFDRWMSDPRCASVFMKLTAAARRLELPGNLGLRVGDILSAADGKALKRREVVLTIGIGCAAMSVAWLGARAVRGPASDVEVHTSTAKREEVTLPDTSRLTLNAESAVDIALDKVNRRIRLRKGRLLANVAPDRHRPFIVETRFGSVQALGTVFQVDMRRDVAEVAVMESRVSVHTAGGISSIITAGERACFNQDTIQKPASTRGGETAWTRGYYVAEDTSLGELIDNLRPYCAGVIRLDPRAAALHVSGAFKLNDPMASIDALTTILPVKVEHLTPLWTRIVQADPSKP